MKLCLAMQPVKFRFYTEYDNKFVQTFTGMRKIMKCCMLLLVLVGQLKLVAQPQAGVTGSAIIKGKIIDSMSGHALEYATISLFEQASGKAVNGTTSNTSGFFKLDTVVAGDYMLLVEFIGYKSFKVAHLSVTRKNMTIDLKTIQLVKDAKLLAAVTVTGQGKLIDNKIDKLVYNAERDLTSQGGVATDILKKVPQVSVDVDGNVELSGSSSIRFLINGKPSTAFGSSISDVLQSIPASQIKSIEVITNPGAKYDAQGLGGIINIILKQNTARGINGNLSLTAGTRMENGSFNFNARKANIGFNAFVSGNARLNSNTPSTALRTSYDTLDNKVLLAQNGSSRFNRHGIESGLGFDWTIKKKNNITGTFNYNVFGNSATGNSNQVQTFLDNAGNAISKALFFNQNSNSSRFHNADISLAYKRTFNKEDQELNISVNSSFGNSTGIASNNQYILPADSLYYGVMARNPGHENETQVQADYSVPVAKDVLLEIGGKTTFLDINSSSAVNSYRTSSQSYQSDSSLSNSLSYHQKVYALYAEISFPVGKLFDVKVGSRYERTQTNDYYSHAQSQMQAPGYNTWVPAVFFSKKLSKDQVIKLSYSKRIERPDYGDLNPFVNTSDPRNITAGNPYLQPEIGQRYELSYSRDFPAIGSFMITAFYRNNSHDIQPYVKYYPQLLVGDSLYQNVSVSTRENIGSEKNTGVNLFVNLHVSNKLTLRSNVFLFHRYIINEVDKGLNRRSFNYRFNINAAYQFSPLLAAEFFGNFNSARNEVQGKYPSFTSYSIAIRKLSRSKKMSLALMATNPFNAYVRQQLELFGSNFNQTSLRKIPFRSVGINFTWKFGRLEFKKDKEENANDPGTIQ